MTGRFEPTHRVSFWGVPCYWNAYNNQLIGVNWLCDKMVSAAVWFHNAMSGVVIFFLPGWEQPGFRFKLLCDFEKEYFESGGTAPYTVKRWWDRGRNN